jgi:hypothetical protein
MHIQPEMGQLIIADSKRCGGKLSVLTFLNGQARPLRRGFDAVGVEMQLASRARRQLVEKDTRRMSGEGSGEDLDKHPW